MPRHILKPLPRGNASAGPSGTGGRHGPDGMDWSTLDRVQVLGSGRADEGHTGCVNALSWSDDGDILLSGSDDKRICIWTPDRSSIPSSSRSPRPSKSSTWTTYDPSSPSSSGSPHPLKLSTSIRTGHRANIFSAKFLPNAGTPTVVTVAGDHEIRLLEIERLSGSGEPGVERWEHGGAGVKVLKCHRDRTKRIATENSPFLFMTVSEDGTVRQHDLRRPHRCRSECPDPLFRAPQGVDLYSLSVSPVGPHIFAVAGRTDTAFICDRRMLEKHTPSWGNQIVGSGQVHCVRRLGLSDEEWNSVQPRGAERMFAGERHVTCVKMSSEHADEAIVAFQRHSTSLFSIYDDPGTSSARRSASPIVPPNEKDRAHPAPVDPTVTPAEVRPISIRKPALGKRKQSDGSPHSLEMASAKQKTDEDGKEESNTAGEASQSPKQSVEDEKEDVVEGWSDPEPTYEQPSTLPGPTIAPMDDPNLIEGLQEEQIRDLIDLDGDSGWETDENAELREQNRRLDEALEARGLPPNPLEWYDPSEEAEHYAAGLLDDDDDMYDDDIDDDEFDEEFEDGGAFDFEAYDDEYGDLDDGLDGFDEDYDEDYDDYDEDEEEDDDDEDEDGPGLVYPDRRSAETEFGTVEMITPRRIFKGAKNIETVKDCNFLGLRSDKVCSGSDDGHFFVWDKSTGKLEGIWEGDGSIVNVMEQHPTLPIVAVSGIDDTIKMFAPTLSPPKPSFNRTHLKDRIIKVNTDPERMHGGSALDRLSFRQFFAAQGLIAPRDGGEDDEEGVPGRPNCETQ